MKKKKIELKREYDGFDFIYDIFTGISAKIILDIKNKIVSEGEFGTGKTRSKKFK